MASRKPLPRVARWLLMAFAGLCVVLGLIGAIVPGMPTTVFILMAAWAAARSSPRMHAWLYAHRLFGPLLRDWDDGGRVARRVKWIATFTMGASAVLVWHGIRTTWVAGLVLGTMAAVLGWLWLRPEPG
ncbi:YbaN family protein [Variovorax sp. PvP013]|jgi:uncharacterized membrane protein YbaN (DUF454 family)|uniref:YbaN family protein n=1 Tax=Variovorax sp. PvP013 TaxID=3156435 RepID=UPI003D241F3B